MKKPIITQHERKLMETNTLIGAQIKYHIENLRLKREIGKSLFNIKAFDTMIFILSLLLLLLIGLSLNY